MTVVMMLLAGCGPTPRAPVLQDDPVYQNSQEGFRFLVPDGWTQSARGEPPPPPVTQERMLVEYRLLGADKPAGLRVSLLDLPAGEDLQAFQKTRWPEDSWTVLSEPEPVQTDGLSGTHLVLSSKEEKGERLTEVVAFQRGNRLYLFQGLVAAEDTKARQQIQRAVESLHWKH
jgi:hypothetical protein